MMPTVLLSLPRRNSEIREGSAQSVESSRTIFPYFDCRQSCARSDEREGDVLFQPVNQQRPLRVVLGYHFTVEAETYVQPSARLILVDWRRNRRAINTLSGTWKTDKRRTDDKLYKLVVGSFLPRVR